MFAIIDQSPYPGDPWGSMNNNGTPDDAADDFPEFNCDYSKLRGLTFATDEAAFLAGYLAAGMTQTGVVGTFGGINIPPVTIFMDGFVKGVRYYNTINGTEVAGPRLGPGHGRRPVHGQLREPRRRPGVR